MKRRSLAVQKRTASAHKLTRMVETTRDLFDRESVMLAVLPFWFSVMFKPLGGSQVPIWKTHHISGTFYIDWHRLIHDVDMTKTHTPHKHAPVQPTEQL